MSYPSVIQPLVIEDEQKSKEHYETVFQLLKQQHQIAPPRWAFCFEDGRTALNEDRIFQLVIIDLRLPEKPGLPASDGLDFGLSLINDCVRRNAYPIPAVLVITGHLAQTRQQELATELRSSFAYGRIVAKSENLEHEIELAVKEIERYAGVGIHIRDSEHRVFPTLSPRDEDLLRRCVLADRQRIGLELGWWASDFCPSSGWTKVLMGRFLLDEGRGHSLYTFFKLATADGAEHVARVAEAMSQKLKHVKLIHTNISGNRSLLVTQAAGSGAIAPLSLDDVLARPSSDVAVYLPKLAATIGEQVAALGDRTPDQREVRRILWQDHDQQRIDTQWKKRGGHEVLATHGNNVHCPVTVFSALASDESILRHDVQSMLHGDLNYTNVAIDEDADGLHAYIFDASGAQAGVCTRDFAMLEVTSLLHQESDEGIAAACIGLYSPGWEFAGVPEAATARQTNTFEFIRAIRRAAVKYAPIEVYALTVVDQSLLQLGGLNFGSQFNKIRNPQDSCLLAALAARWYLSLRPSYAAPVSDLS